MKLLGWGGLLLLARYCSWEVMEIFLLPVLQVKLTANCGRLLNDERGNGKHEIKMYECSRSDK